MNVGGTVGMSVGRAETVPMTWYEGLFGLRVGWLVSSLAVGSLEGRDLQFWQ